MLVGAVIRNFDDRTGWVGLSVQTTDLIGNVCLALFLAVALMNLKLWELSGLALPLIVNLGLQVALVVLFCVPVVRIMGRDYDAAVMGGGFIGFMLGTTANAMAVMRTLVLRYGMAPRAFLVAPLVGVEREMKYELDGDQVRVMLSGDNDATLVLMRVDEDTLSGPLGIRYRRK